MRPQKVNTRPSAAHRWLACPGSAWVATAVMSQPVTLDKEGKRILAPGQASSPDAAEGTMGHAHLSHALTGRDLKDFMKPEDEVLVLPDEDLKLIGQMADVIKGLRDLNGFEMHVETDLRIMFEVCLGPDPDDLRLQVINGRADVILVNARQLMVLDYKHGAGRPVEVRGNPQLTLYGLMALQKYPGLELTIGVIQPRGRGRGIDMWACPPEYLEDFKASCIAAICKCLDPWPSFNIGPWCWGCAGHDLGACPAVLEHALKYAVGVQGTTEHSLPMAWWLLEHAKHTAKVAGKLEEEALSFAKRGGEVPGWRLERRKGNRRWSEPDEVPSVLARLTGDPVESFMKPRPKAKPIGILEAERHPKLKGKPLDKYMRQPTTEVLVKADGDLQLFDEIE